MRVHVQYLTEYNFSWVLSKKIILCIFVSLKDTIRLFSDDDQSDDIGHRLENAVQKVGDTPEVKPYKDAANSIINVFVPTTPKPELVQSFAIYDKLKLIHVIKSYYNSVPDPTIRDNGAREGLGCLSSRKRLGCLKAQRRLYGLTFITGSLAQNVTQVVTVLERS